MDFRTFSDLIMDEPIVNHEEATRLFKIIKSKDWTECLSHARSHPREVYTWISLKNDKYATQTGIVLPIHVAISAGAPMSVIETLVELYPKSVKKQDDKGNLPLHLAANNVEPDDALLNFLLGKYPKGLLRHNNNGISIVCYADIPVLHKILLDKKWDYALERAESHPEEAMTWMVKTDKLSGKIKVRFVALHLAIDLGAPEDVLDALLEAFPEGVRCADEEKMIPLQRALLKPGQDMVGVKKLIKPLMYTEKGVQKVAISCC